MPSLAIRTLERFHVSSTRLVREREMEIEPAQPCRERVARPVEHPSTLGADHDPAREREPPILLAGRDSARRAILLDELIQTMPQSTTFEVAGAFSEVLEHAPASRMVILSGDLPDVSAESFASALGRRHPRLPVIRLEARPSGDDLCARA